MPLKHYENNLGIHSVLDFQTTIHKCRRSISNVYFLIVTVVIIAF